MPDAIALRQSKHGVLISIRVQPGSRAKGVASVAKGVLRVQVSAAPVDGAANAEVIEILAKTLSCARNHFCFARGERSREKTICISGFSIEEIQSRLTAIAASD